MANGTPTWVDRLVAAILGGDEVTWLRALVLAVFMTSLAVFTGFIPWPLRTELAAQGDRLASIETALRTFIASESARVAYQGAECRRLAKSATDREDCDVIARTLERRLDKIDVEDRRRP